jgi:hypothetical protein
MVNHLAHMVLPVLEIEQGSVYVDARKKAKIVLRDHSKLEPCEKKRKGASARTFGR